MQRLERGHDERARRRRRPVMSGTSTARRVTFIVWWSKRKSVARDGYVLAGTGADRRLHAAVTDVEFQRNARRRLVVAACHEARGRRPAAAPSSAGSPPRAGRT